MTRDPFVLVCGRRHRLAEMDQIAWAGLANCDLITLGGGSGNRRLVEAQLVAAGLPPRSRFVVETTLTALALCIEGVGAAVSPASNSSRLVPGLVEVPLVEPLVCRSIGLVHRRGKTLSPAARALYGLLQAELPRPAA